MSSLSLRMELALLARQAPAWLTRHEAEQMDKVARARELAHTSHLLNHHHESVEGCVWCTQLLKRVEGF